MFAEEARAINDGQLQAVSAHWRDVCEEAGLGEAERSHVPTRNRVPTSAGMTYRHVRNQVPTWAGLRMARPPGCKLPESGI